MKSEPYILCAAIWYDDGREYPHQPKNIAAGKVFCGHRHCSIFQLMPYVRKERREMGIKETQGFLTNDNRFVDREEAAAIALASGQIAEPVPELISEHLY